MPMKKPTGILVLSILLAIVSVALIALLAYFLYLRKKDNKNANEDYWMQTLIENNEYVGSWDGPLKRSLTTRTVDGSTWTYSMLLEFSKFEAESNQILVFGRGAASASITDMDMIVYLQGSSNDMYIGFKKSTGSTSSDEILSKFCVFHIENVPLFRFFTLDIAYNYNASVCYIYLDGNLIKLINIGDCSSALTMHSGTTVFCGYYMMNMTEPLSNSMIRWEPYDCRKLVVYNKVLTSSEINKHAKSSLGWINKQVQKENAMEEGEKRCVQEDS